MQASTPTGMDARRVNLQGQNIGVPGQRRGQAGHGDQQAHSSWQGTSTIGYGALHRDTVPCSRRSNGTYSSYQICRGHGHANPYGRGCCAITRCRGVDFSLTHFFSFPYFL
ncbi:hypothetical protein I3842_07G021700 [Carya illinoinensis]|uniref:Uncharacterized protein n=1 Tax=Carya illinoinensis TaxID=32201 RepID=A0A922JDS6_CARIL|nr:hypothetical protein I3842_07G021700 [Carya illinoinensis]